MQPIERGGTMFQEVFPILTVTDLEPALAFNRDQLEFVEIYRYPEQGDPVYVGLELGTSRLGIGLDPRVLSGEGRPAIIDRPFDLWVYADDCDVAVDRLRSVGVQVVEEPADQLWGERMARVKDPDGNGVTVAERAR
jgi:lactoylglutathione lyase